MISRLPGPLALVFDLDGTLVDSRRDIAEACNHALERHGREPLPLERILPMIGDGARALVARALASPPDDPFVDGVLATFREFYLANPCVHTVLLPGAREALAAGPPCALVTNKPRDVTQLVLDALGIAGSFAALWGGGDGPLKPAPDGILAVADRLGVSAHDTWMIGDGPQDVLAGRAAGAFTVAVRGIADEERLLASKPDRVIASLDEIPALVRADRA
ncbi:MAG: HAD-IA family hydrolase [Deltaproteobacteria bacterium]|nr:HAD-IA family hydrolase [Deltaproteobacteria bacterium]